MNSSTYYVIDPPALQVLLKSLRQHGYDLVGPTIRDNAVVYGEITNVEDMPVGWGDEQEAGTYRLRKRNDKMIFGFNLGPQSWKKYLFPSALRLLTSVRTKDGLVFGEAENDGTGSQAGEASGARSQRFAFIGVRPCELRAILVQDKVLTGGQDTDPYYASLRSKAFIVAVNCAQAAATCFCTSMNTGPRADNGFDLSLTEVMNESLHYFLVQVGSRAGEEIMGELPHREAVKSNKDDAARVVERTASSMKRKMDTTDVKSLLQGNPEHPRWSEVATRCLACANCTMVCPTCFCHTVQDTTDLTGAHAERWRTWDSCFTTEFSYIHGGSIRVSPKSRYRQWLTHKLANWFDQFGMSGCVGCGRCIAWCPVGIDITEEVSALRKPLPVHHAGKTTSPTTTKTEAKTHGDA